MKKTGTAFELSATDLVGYLNCRHLSDLDRAVAVEALAKPKVWDQLLQVLWERGSIHEQNYVTHLERSGLEVVRIDSVDITEEAVKETLTAMKQGARIGSDLPNYLFQFSLCAIYAYYFSLKPPFCHQNKGGNIPMPV